ncbi:MAG: hypothetical protein ACXU84_06590 [Xanthobacteraceae bacterium]
MADDEDDPHAPYMFDHRRRDHVAFGIGQELLFSADLESPRTSLRNSSVTVGARAIAH